MEHDSTTEVAGIPSSGFKKGEMNIASVISLFRKKPKFLSVLKRKSQRNLNQSSGEEERKDKENATPMLETCAMTKTMGLYIQVVNCFSIWKMKPVERMKTRKFQQEKEKSRRRQSLLAR